MKKIIACTILTFILTLSLAGCGNGSTKETVAETVTENTESETEQTTQEDIPSGALQSEWIASGGADNMEDGYEKVENINIDSGDTKLEMKNQERYTLENGEEVLLVYFEFSNISAGETNVDAQYNFKAFQDGIEITIYSAIWEDLEAAENRSKSILSGAAMEIAVAILPDNWDSPIKLRVDDAMFYDSLGTEQKFQQQELEVK